MTSPAAALVQYGQHQKIPAGTACAGCGSTDKTRRATDHCHQHGWVRGIVCPSCNARMITIDQMGTPSAVDETLLAALLALRQRCPECLPISPADLAPSLSAAKQRARDARERALIEKVMEGRARLGFERIPPSWIIRPRATIRRRNVRR